MRRPLRWVVPAGVLLVGFLVVPSGTAAQSSGTQVAGRIDLESAPRPTARAARAPGRVTVDGVLDDQAWSAAPVIDAFIQQKPDAGLPATERTEVRLLYDDEHLYIGAEMSDSRPGELVVPTLQRDPNTRDGDAFGFTFDTFRDGQSSYAFIINPGGAVRDAQTSDDGRVSNAAWDAAYELRTRIHDRGWTVEMAIPWSSLRFDGSRTEQVWGMNLLRRIRRKNEDAVWAPMDRQWQLYVMSRAGTLRGLDGIQPGRNLSVKPWVLTADPSGEQRVGDDAELDGGLDVKLGLTPGMSLDLTLNTDFSQVEVDQEQVNLDRFSLFFPEKREFFLENAGIFQFGDQGTYTQRTGVTNRDFTLFHSRRIGLTPGGTPLPILAGGRISGTAGPVSVGLLSMQTREQDGFAPENFTVARVRGDVVPGLTVGGIFINRMDMSEGVADNQSYGADVNLLAMDGGLLIQSYLAATQGTDGEGSPIDRAFAGRVSVGWRDPLWEVMALYRQLDDDFRPGVGFVRRGGVRHGYATVGLHPRPDVQLLQELNPYVDAHYYEGIDGGLQTRRTQAGLDADFGDGGTAALSVSDVFEQVQNTFSVRGATVSPGAYDFVEASASYTASRARTLSGRLTVSGGGYFGGDRFSVGGSVLGRIGHRWLLDLSAQHNAIDLPGQAPVSADVYGAKLNAFFSTRLLTTVFMQYNEASETLVTNVRLNWIHAPLSDLYLVLTEIRDTAQSRVLDRLITLKVTRQISF